MAKIDFYFDFVSPYAYLANLRLPKLAREHGCEIAYHAIDLAAAKAAAGNTAPPTAAMPAKLKYAIADFARWGERYGDRTAYLGTDQTGPDAVPLLHFPGLDPEAARWIVGNRAVAAVGIDTPSIDYGQSTTFDSHVILYSDKIPGFENDANLEQMPPAGGVVFALPMKIEGGRGAPLRIVGGRGR